MYSILWQATDAVVIRTSCAKLYTLLLLDSSTNRRNEIIFLGSTISVKYGNRFGDTILRFLEDFT